MAEGDGAGVDRNVPGGGEFQHEGFDRRGRAEGEVAVVGEVHHRIPGRRGAVAQAQFTGVGPAVAAFDGQFSGEALVAGGADVGQNEGHFVLFRNGRGGPQLLVESIRPAVQRVLAVVDRQVVGFAVQREFSVRDPVAVAADEGPEIGVIFQVGRQRVVPEHQFGSGHGDAGDDAAVVGDFYVVSTVIREREKLGGAVRRVAEIPGSDAGHGKGCGSVKGARVRGWKRLRIRPVRPGRGSAPRRRRQGAGPVRRWRRRPPARAGNRRRRGPGRWRGRGCRG